MTATSEILYYIENYTERSDAVIGAVDREATRPFKAQLARLGGKFNGSLRDDRTNERVPGWIFSIKSSQDNNLKDFIDRVNSGEILGDSSGSEGSGERRYGRPSIVRNVAEEEPPRRKKVIPIKKEEPPVVTIDVKITPEDFEDVRKKRKSSVLIHTKGSISDIKPGYSFNFVEYDTDNQDEDNLIRLRKTAVMTTVSKSYDLIKGILGEKTVTSLDVPDTDQALPMDGYWLILHF